MALYITAAYGLIGGLRMHNDFKFKNCILGKHRYVKYPPSSFKMSSPIKKKIIVMV